MDLHRCLFKWLPGPHKDLRPAHMSCAGPDEGHWQEKRQIVCGLNGVKWSLPTGKAWIEFRIVSPHLPPCLNGERSINKAGCQKGKKIRVLVGPDKLISDAEIT